MDPHQGWIVREGIPYVLVPAFLSLGVGTFLGIWGAVPFALLALFLAWFFRNPDRTPPPGEEGVVAPADGRVVEVERGVQRPVLGDPGVKIGIFMGILDVHVNRAPATGKILERVYRPGGFLAADRPEASHRNEQNIVVLETPRGDRLVWVQVAGLVARRIVCWVRPGDTLQRGQRFGLIRFGSRVDLYLPLDVEIRAQKGQRVRAGESVVARWKSQGEGA